MSRESQTPNMAYTVRYTCISAADRAASCGLWPDSCRALQTREMWLNTYAHGRCQCVLHDATQGRALAIQQGVGWKGHDEHLCVEHRPVQQHLTQIRIALDWAVPTDDVYDAGRVGR